MRAYYVPKNRENLLAWHPKLTEIFKSFWEADEIMIRILIKTMRNTLNALMMTGTVFL